MIEFRNVSLAFEDHVVLDHVSFTVEFGEKIAVLGGSGEGKTTMLRLILGLLRPDAGKIIIDGQNIVDMRESSLRAIRMNFSIVFQEGALFDSMNVRENVAFCLREYGNFTEQEIGRQVMELLDKLGIGHAIDLMPEELSGGMQRRVAIARSLAGCSPKMVLYDEATTGLDPLTADTICNVINELAQGSRAGRTGFIIVTHKVTDAVKVAERFMYLRKGRIVFDGDINEMRNTEDQEIRQFTEELHIADKFIQ